MAERYSGPYSPDPRSQPPGGLPPVSPPRPRASRAGRARWLYLGGFFFVLTAFWQEPAGLALDLAAFALLTLAARLTRDGILAAEEFAARTAARRPAIPRKLFAAVLTGAGLFAGGYVAGASPVNPLLFAVLGLALHLAAFGPDPMRDKGAEGVDPFQRDRAARLVSEGEAYLAAMKDAILRAGDPRLTARVERFQASARQLFDRIQADPRDLTAARRFLGVYLMGARDATQRFADLWLQSHDATARAAWEALLGDLEAGFAQHAQALLSGDRADLDLEIDVLRDRLRRDGIAV